MAFNIQEIKSQLAYGGSRPSFFQVALTNPISTLADLKLPFMCKASALPESTVGVIPVPYFGRDIKVAGTRKFSQWDITVINDNDFLIRQAMETWCNSINSLEGNLNTTGSPAPLNYKSQGIITQYDPTGAEVRIYQFEGIWPSSVGPMQMDWSQGDAIGEFTVTLQYDSWRIAGGTTGTLQV